MDTNSSQLFMKCDFYIRFVWCLNYFFNRISRGYHKNIQNDLRTSREALWNIWRSFKLRREDAFRYFLFGHAYLANEFFLAGADSRTVLFGTVLLLFHSVGFEKVSNSEYCLTYICSLSDISCSLSHCFWRPAWH